VGNLEAIEAYSHAVVLKPDFAIGWYNISLFHFHLHHYHDAVLAAERALAVDPDHDEPHVVIGMARRESGDLDGAVTAFKRAADKSELYGSARQPCGTQTAPFPIQSIL
jgi:protein O-GlcNAc transferase